MNPSYFLSARPNETPRQRLVRAVQSMDGASLSNRRDDLMGLVARGVDDPSWAYQVVQWQTNCGTSALGFLAAICGSVDAARTCHPILATRSQNGASIPWLMEIGYGAHAWRTYEAGGPAPKAGDLLHYGVLGANVDHVEWLLDDEPGTAGRLHGGGGRWNNAIQVQKGDIRTSTGHPLLAFLDLDALSIPVTYAPDGALADDVRAR